MTDNVTTPVPASTTLAADDVGGILYPRVKLSIGADGAAADITPTNRLPVELPAGAATAAAQATGNTSLAKSAPSDTYVPITLGTGNLATGACRAIIAEVAGRVNLKQPDGTLRENFPLSAGLNPVGALMISAPTSGTAATGVWALY